MEHNLVINLPYLNATGVAFMPPPMGYSERGTVFSTLIYQCRWLSIGVQHVFSSFGMNIHIFASRRLFINPWNASQPSSYGLFKFSPTISCEVLTDIWREWKFRKGRLHTLWSTSTTVRHWPVLSLYGSYTTHEFYSGKNLISATINSHQSFLILFISDRNIHHLEQKAAKNTSQLWLLPSFRVHSSTCNCVAAFPTNWWTFMASSTRIWKIFTLSFFYFQGNSQPSERFKWLEFPYFWEWLYKLLLILFAIWTLFKFHAYPTLN